MVMWWGDKMGKHHCSAVKLPCTATVYPSFWETEECCTVCFPILHCTFRGKCHVHAHRSTDIQTYMHKCNGKLLVSFCTAYLNLWLKCMAWSIVMWLTVGVSPLPIVSFEADPITLKCLGNTNSSQ